MIWVYGKKNCEYCDDAKDLLEETGLDYTYIDVHEKPETLEFMKTRGHASVPQVYNEDVHIGGFTDMKAWLKRHYPMRVTLAGDIRL